MQRVHMSQRNGEHLPEGTHSVCCSTEWIPVVVYAPKADTHSFHKETGRREGGREGGNLWLRKWYLPVDRLQIIMHFWIAVKNRFLFFEELCFWNLTVTQSNSTSQGLRMVVTWKSKNVCDLNKMKKKKGRFFFSVIEKAYKSKLISKFIQNL